MNRLLLLLCLLFPLFIFSQNDNPVTVDVDADAIFASNSLSYNMINKFFEGGKIDNEEKEEWSKHIKAKNKAFFDASAGVNVLWQLSEEKKYKLGVNYKMRLFAETQFTENLWRTGLYGNSQFGTETVYLGDNNATYTLYRDLKAVFESQKWNIDDNTKIWFTADGGFRMGITHFGLTATDFTMRNTTELSEKIEINGNFDLTQSPLRYINGIGGAMDVGLHFKGTFATENEWQLHLFTKNFGFVYWNYDCYKLSKNLDFDFEGIEIDLAHLSGSMRNGTDSLIAYLTDNAQRKSFITATPASLHIKPSLTFKNYYPIIIGVECELACSVFSNFIFFASAAPSIAKEWKKESSRQQLFFKLPLRYCNYSGIGLGGEIAYQYIKNEMIGGSISLEGGVTGFRSAAFYTAIKLSLSIN